MRSMTPASTGITAYRIERGREPPVGNGSRSSAARRAADADACGLARRARLVWERGELDQLVAREQAGAGDAVLGEAQVAAQADPVVLADAREEDRLQELFGRL